MKHSRQIRPPIYSLKQSKLRKRRVVRYAILYFTLLILFVVLIIGPVIVSKVADVSLTIDFVPGLVQPTGLNNNDTSASKTGAGLLGAADASAAATTAASSASAAARRWVFNEYAY